MSKIRRVLLGIAVLLCILCVSTISMVSKVFAFSTPTPYCRTDIGCIGYDYVEGHEVIGYCTDLGSYGCACNLVNGGWDWIDLSGPAQCKGYS